MNKKTDKKALRTGLLLLVAVTMVVTAMMGGAMAYFTTYATAKGGKVLKFGHQERITEDLYSNEKRIKITSDEDSKSTYIRARGFCSSDHSVEYSEMDSKGNPLELGTNWRPGNDGWYYYNSILPPGGTTETLVAKVEIPKGDDFEIGDSFNVIVVYESADVQYEFKDNDPSKEANAIPVDKIIKNEELKKAVWKDPKVQTGKVSSGGEEE